MPEPTPPTEHPGHTEALDWLSGRFRWETLLSELHELATREMEMVEESDAA